MAKAAKAKDDSDLAKYPIAYYFSLSFKGEDAAFQEVSGISKELTVEEVTGGGENRFKYRLPAVGSSQNLVLKRAMVAQASQLVSWCACTLDEGFANPIQTHDLSLSLLDASGTVCVMWTFYKAYPLKYSVSELKSQENGLVIETIELAYTYFKIASDKQVAAFSISKLFN